MDKWLGNRKKILVLNREDMVSKADRSAWASYFSEQGVNVIFANGQLGMVTTTLLLNCTIFYFISLANIYVFLIQNFSLMQFQGTMKLSRLAKSLASDVNVKRRAKGLLPRPVLFFPFLVLPE